MKPISVSITNNSVTAIFALNLKPQTIRNGTPQFKLAKEAYKQKNWKTFKDSFSLKSIVDSGEVSIFEKFVVVNGVVVENYITKKLVELSNSGYDFTPLLNFFKKLINNPNQELQSEILQFLEASNFPILENGNFLAYKKVKSDYRSFHSNLDGSTNVNKVGTIFKMERSKVDADREVTCSTGLHACAYSYLSEYETGENNRVMVVEINPKDVVAFPVDHNKAKLRCCEYTIVAEVIDSEHSNPLKEGVEYGFKSDGTRYWNFRVKGKFSKKIG
jgi:hypothetical protein